MTNETDEVCSTCHGHGFRVEIAPGQTVNVNTAREAGLMSGARRLCHCQAADVLTVHEEALKPQVRIKPTRQKSIDVAGIKPVAYVDQAET